MKKEAITQLATEIVTSEAVAEPVTALPVTEAAVELAMAVVTLALSKETEAFQRGLIKNEKEQQ
jgi:hypothetical protein